MTSLSSLARHHPSTQLLIYFSLTLNAFLLAIIVVGFLFLSNNDTSNNSNSAFVVDGNKQFELLLKQQQIVWHGGHPLDGTPLKATTTRKKDDNENVEKQQKYVGSCYCGADSYCMCTPSLAIDLIILERANGNNENNDTIMQQKQKDDNDLRLWLVRRKDTNQFATMGGFVNVGETVEEAVQRELMEEMGLDLDLVHHSSNDNQQPAAIFGKTQDTIPKRQSATMKLVGVYSDPRRDARRRHTVSVVFAVQLGDEGEASWKSMLRAGSDAKAIESISIHDIDRHDFFADHKTILTDYYTKHVDGTGNASNDDVARSTCTS